jgi:hypothetical protein
MRDGRCWRLSESEKRGWGMASGAGPKLRIRLQRKVATKLRIEENLNILRGWSGRFKLLISLGHVTGN